MRRIIAVIISVLALLSINVSPASAEWFGMNWPVAQTPPTHVKLIDTTTGPLSAFVKSAADTWTAASPDLVLDYINQPGASVKPGALYVVAAYLPNASASWCQPLTTGNKTIIKKASVLLNTWHDVFSTNLDDPTFDATRNYLVRHEMGGCLGLMEACWPYPDPYHYGVMNLCFQGTEPSQADKDTLTQVYGGQKMPNPKYEISVVTAEVGKVVAYADYPQDNHNYWLTLTNGPYDVYMSLQDFNGWDSPQPIEFGDSVVPLNEGTYTLAIRERRVVAHSMAWRTVAQLEVKL